MIQIKYQEPNRTEPHCAAHNNERTETNRWPQEPLDFRTEPNRTVSLLYIAGRWTPTVWRRCAVVVRATMPLLDSRRRLNDSQQNSTRTGHMIIYGAVLNSTGMPTISAQCNIISSSNFLACQLSAPAHTASCYATELCNRAGTRKRPLCLRGSCRINYTVDHHGRQRAILVRPMPSCSAKTRASIL